MAKKSSTSKKSKNIDLEKELASKQKDSVLAAVFKREFWKILSAVLVLLLLISLYSGGAVSTSNPDKIAQDTVDYINTELLQGQATATLIEVNESNGLVILTMDLNGQPIMAYVTSDGNMLFAQPPFDMTQPVQRPDAQPPQQPADIPKSATPTVELYVMSFCPYGNQAEDAMYPVYQLLTDQVDLNIRYIVSVSGEQVNSLHGQPETDQNIRELCVQKESGNDAFWKFITYVNANCGSKGECWEDAAAAAGADTVKIQECVDTEGLNLMKQEAVASNAAGVSGSPTIIINGAKYTGPRSADAYKTAICSAFNTAPEECGAALTETAVAAAGSC